MIKTITVIGANGTMGYNVSGIFAAFGNATVYMVSRSKEKSMHAIEKAAKSVKADAVKKNMIPADYSMLEQCILESDLIFESVAEDFNTKFNIYKEISEYVGSDKIICTGTSGLSIKYLAEALPTEVRKNFLGVHFYNPPYNLTLCELIPSVYTKASVLKNVEQYVTNTLFRTTVVVKDAPAFLGNRIGFQFINEALQFAEKYKDNGGIDYIDAILGQFTGRSMSPINTADFVGLDVHKAIVDNLYNNTDDYARETFILPNYAQDLINEGKLGRKSNGGLYKMETNDSGIKKSLVYDIASKEYRQKIKYKFPFAESMIASLRIGDYDEAIKSLVSNHSIEAEIALEFLLKYVLYSLNTTYLVGEGIHAADDVMAMGFNWCPPLAVIQALNRVSNFKQLLSERLQSNMLSELDLDKLLEGVEESKYDYRRYFKAK